MKNLTNAQVAMNFVLQCRGTSYTGNFDSFGNTLFSYSTAIAAWYKCEKNGWVLIVNTTKYSPTTSGKHMCPLKREIEKRGIKYYAVQGKYNASWNSLVQLYLEKYVNVG